MPLVHAAALAVLSFSIVYAGQRAYVFVAGK